MDQIQAVYEILNTKSYVCIIRVSSMAICTSTKQISTRCIIDSLLYYTALYTKVFNKLSYNAIITDTKISHH